MLQPGRSFAYDCSLLCQRCCFSRGAEEDTPDDASDERQPLRAASSEQVLITEPQPQLRPHYGVLHNQYGSAARTGDDPAM